jgi:DNA-binding Xre family transcriptional regulator
VSVTRWFHLRVQAELRERDWSSRELARRADCSASTFTRLKNDEGTSLEVAARIADALDMLLSDLIAPIQCEACKDAPPAGFDCQSCGAKGVSRA